MKLPSLSLNAKQQRVIVGLGNPGKQYEMTRHNYGKLVVQELCHSLNWSLKPDRALETEATRGIVDGIEVHLLCPTTYMNNSGIAIRKYLNYFKLKADTLIVVSDDIAIAYGEMRLKPSGSAGGHNGLKSVEENLSTQEYTRLRMGIGRLSESPLADYVLSPFSSQEMGVLPQLLHNGAGVLKSLLKDPLQVVMNRINNNVSKTSREEQT